MDEISIVQSFIKRNRQLQFFKQVTLPQTNLFHLHAVITSCGHEKVTSQQYRHHGLRRGNKPFASLQFTLAGKGALIHEGQVLSLEKGNAMLEIIPHNHEYYLPEGSDYWEFVYITFAGSEIIRILQYIQASRGPIFPVLNIQALSLFENILHKAALQETTVFSFSALAYSFVMALLQEIHTIESKNANDLVFRAKSYCDFHYKIPIHIEDIAKQLSISKYHLSRIFHKETSITIQKYIESVRIQASVQKLINTNLSIKSIALDCGFSNASYFTYVFRTHYGYNPSTFRQQK